MYTLEKFILGLQKIWSQFVIEYVDEEQLKISHAYSTLDDPETTTKEIIAEIPISELVELIDAIPADFVITELLGHTDTSCEVMVQPDRANGPSLRYFDREQYVVDNNNYSFTT